MMGLGDPPAGGVTRMGVTRMGQWMRVHVSPRVLT